MLTDLACRKAQPAARDYKLTDGGSLFLLVTTKGAKSWRWKYRFGGKTKQLVIGRYPAVSIGAARKARDEARALVDKGIDPGIAKQQAKARAATAALDSFEAIARAWHTVRKQTLAKRYGGQVLDRLEADVFPQFGSLPIGEITPPIVLAAIRRIEARGSTEMAHRVRMHISDVFVWAIASGLAENDPAAIIRKALVPTSGKLRPALIRIEEARAMLAASEKVEGAWWATREASKLLALTAARPGVVRLAEKKEFEGLGGPSPIWRIPAEKMKLTRERKRDASFEFVIPLSRQAAAVAAAAIARSPSPDWLFPGAAGWKKPISDSTLSKHYRDAKYRDRHVPHGWRASFSTIMNERAGAEGSKDDREIIELMLAHVQEGVEASYNRALYLPRRRELAQIWADMLMPD